MKTARSMARAASVAVLPGERALSEGADHDLPAPLAFAGGQHLGFEPLPLRSLVPAGESHDQVVGASVCELAHPRNDLVRRAPWPPTIAPVVDTVVRD